MTEPTREKKLSVAFVALADTLVADFDLIELLQTLIDTCVDLLGAQAAGLMLRSSSGELQVLVSTTGDVEFVEIVQLGAAAGPCWECAQTGTPVSVGDIEAEGGRWPEFQQAALQRGFRSVHATPLRLRDDVLGTMNLFDTRVGVLSAEDTAAAQALSDVASIGILSERSTRDWSTLAIQLQNALDSRVVIEQAKGILAHSDGLSMDDAFATLRSFARSHNVSLRMVALAVVERRMDPSHLAADVTTRAHASTADRADRRR